MDFLRQWVLGVAGAAMIGAATLAVTPQGTVKKVLRVGAALLLVVSVLRPLAGWNLTLPEWTGIDTEETEKTGQELLTGIIAEKTAAYIESEAQAVGLVVSVTAECRMGKVYPEPWSVTIVCDRYEHAMNTLSDRIEKDLGIPKERQTYKEAVP